MWQSGEIDESSKIPADLRSRLAVHVGLIGSINQYLKEDRKARDDLIASIRVTLGFNLTDKKIERFLIETEMYGQSEAMGLLYSARAEGQVEGLSRRESAKNRLTKVDLRRSGRVKFMRRNDKRKVVTLVYEQGEGGPFRMANLGCGGTGDKNQKMVGAALAGLPKGERADAVIVLGDFIYPNGYTNKSQLKEYLYDPYNNVDAVFLLALGNHEYKVCKVAEVTQKVGIINKEITVDALIKDLEAEKKFHMPSSYYAIKVTQDKSERENPEAVYIVLDSNTFPYDNMQQSWFIATLKESVGSKVYVACHHGPMTYSKRHKQGRSYQKDANMYAKKFDWLNQGGNIWAASQNKVFKQAFYNCIRQAEKLPQDILAMFSAHDHLMMVAAGKQANLFVCGGGGGRLQKATQLPEGVVKNQIHAYASSFGFAIHHCDPKQPKVKMFVVEKNRNAFRSGPKARLLSESVIMCGETQCSMHTKAFDQGAQLESQTTVERKLVDGHMAFTFKQNSLKRQQKLLSDVKMPEDSFNSLCERLGEDVEVDAQKIRDKLVPCLQYIGSSTKRKTLAPTDASNPLLRFVISVEWDNVGYSASLIKQLLKLADKMCEKLNMKGSFKERLAEEIARIDLLLISSNRVVRDESDIALVAKDCLRCFADVDERYKLHGDVEKLPERVRSLTASKFATGRYKQREFFKQRLNEVDSREKLINYFDDVVTFIPSLIKGNSHKLLKAVFNSILPIIELFDTRKAEEKLVEVRGKECVLAKGEDEYKYEDVVECLVLQCLLSAEPIDKQRVINYLTKQHSECVGQNNSFIKRALEKLIDQFKLEDEGLIERLLSTCSAFNREDENTVKEYKISIKHMQKLQLLASEYKRSLNLDERGSVEGGVEEIPMRKF